MKSPRDRSTATATVAEHELTSESSRDQPSTTSAVVELQELSSESPRDRSTATSTVAEHELTSESSRDQSSAMSAIVQLHELSSELPHDQPQDVMSPFIETKRFYGSSRLIRQQIANKVDVDPTGNVGRRCGRNRKLPDRYLD